VSFAVTENHQWWRTVLLGDVQFTVDHWMNFKDIGSGDGLGKDSGNWSDAVCPTNTGGNYGGIATDPDSPDKECRTVWAEGCGYRRTAFVKLSNRYEAPTKVVVRVLDGIADDSFDVYIRRTKDIYFWELVDSYESDPSTSEYWIVHEIPLDGEFPKWSTYVKIEATGPQWEQKVREFHLSDLCFLGPCEP